MRYSYLFSLFTLIYFCAGYTSTTAAQKVAYHVDFTNRVHHEAKITITVPSPPKEQTLLLRMSRSSAGRYALHEFAKNIYNVKAYDNKNNPLHVVRTSPHTWSVLKPTENTQIEYTLFADHADGTYSGINSIQAHLNAPATYLLVDNYYTENQKENKKDEQTIKITFSLPQNENWSVATQLPKLNDSTFFAPNYYYLLDAPVLIGDLDWNEWQEGAQTYKTAILHLGEEQAAKDYTEHVKKIVREEIALFGEAPQFDYGTYTFLLNYQPTAHGDGMEHRNSTIISESEGIKFDHLFTVAHEFIHAWNIERLRPKDLEPFDFSQANMSNALWFGEGFTTYYTYIIMRRAGLIDDASFAQMMGGRLNYVVTSPGHLFHSPIEMSQQAPFADAATANDPLCHHNTFISYYPYGAVIGLALDMELRSRFNKSLDGYMQLAWKTLGAPEKSYDVEDLKNLLYEYTKDKTFAEEFFAMHIRGNKLPDYEKLLQTVALGWKYMYPESKWLGKLNLKQENTKLVVDNYTLVGSPLYEAGIEKGDTLLAINGTTLTSPEDYQSIRLEASKNNEETAKVKFSRFGKEYETVVKWEQIPYKMMLVLDTEINGITPTQVAEREKWLGSQQGK